MASKRPVATILKRRCKRVLADDCQVFVVQTGLYDGANLRALAAERRMEQLAVKPAARCTFPRQRELDDAFQADRRGPGATVRLELLPGRRTRDGRFHVIDLRVKSRKDVRVRARKGYYSPKASNVAERTGNAM